LPGRFSSIDGQAPPRVVLEQLSDTTFRLKEGFRYADPSRNLDLTIFPEDLPATDLASVPWFLRWFVPAYGRHSLAALLHDYLLEKGGDRKPPIARDAADEIFLEALGALGVPRVRRHLMGVAVSLETRLSLGGRSRLRMRSWLVASLLGTGVLLLSIVTGPLWLVIGALLAPVLGAFLWWPQFRTGLIAGYGSAILGPPSVMVALSYLVYWISEIILGASEKRRPPPALGAGGEGDS
jgi:hypothetical protein